MNERRFAVDEGVELYARVWDEGDGVPVLLLHGLASNCRTWDAVAARLHELGHPVAAVDQRGHGRSDKPDAGYDYDTLCRDQVRMMDALGFDRPLLAGQSFGGNLVVELAHRRPDRAAAVVGVDGGLIELRRRFPVWEECERVLAPPRLEGTPAAEIEAWLRREHPDWSDEGIAATLANFEMLADGTVRPWLPRDRHLRILRAMWEERPSAILSGITVPLTFILAGGPDESSAEQAVETGDIHLVWLAGADHDLHVQHPRQVAHLIRMGLERPALA